MSIRNRAGLKGFAKLHGRLRLLEQRYNPKNENLHFTGIEYGDADLYPQLLSLAGDALNTVKRDHANFDEMFWYDLFLLVSAAAHRVRADKADRYIPEVLVNKLIVILIRIAAYTTIEELDITKRNYEALANTLLAFYNKDRVRFIPRQAQSSPQAVKRLVKHAVGRVKELRTEPIAAE
jgi:hypothetical protein